MRHFRVWRMHAATMPKYLLNVFYCVRSFFCVLTTFLIENFAEIAQSAIRILQTHRTLITESRVYRNLEYLFCQ